MMRACFSRPAWASRDMASCSESGMITSRISTDCTLTPHGLQRWSMSSCNCSSIFSRPRRRSVSDVRPMMSRSAVWAAQLTASLYCWTSSAAFSRSYTIQKSTASTFTGTVSDVSVCSAAKLVVITRWSIHDDTESISGTTQNSPGPFMAVYLPRRRMIAFSHCWATFGDSAAMMPRSIAPMNQSGLSRVMPRARPAPGMTSSSRSAMTFTRGSSPRGVLELPVGGTMIMVRLLP